MGLSKKKKKNVPMVKEVAWWHGQGGRSDLFAGQNRKLTPENRIREEKEIFLRNALRASRRSSKAGKMTFGPRENNLYSSF